MMMEWDGKMEEQFSQRDLNLTFSPEFEICRAPRK